MADYLVRAIGGAGSVRVFVAASSVLAEEARRRHDTWPTATAALSRGLTATVLLSATLKEENESVTLRIAGNGPLGGMICDADANGHVRGYVQHPHVDLDSRNGKFDVAAAVGSGHIHVTRQLAVEGVYTGSAELISGEIGEDVTYYLTQSEQTPSAVGVGVRIAPDGQVRASGGYLVQLLPGAGEAEREQLEHNILALGSVSKLVEEGASPEEILAAIMAGLDFQMLQKRDLRFACRCSRARVLSAIAMVGKEELERMIVEDKGAEAACRFCAETYRFSDAELEALKQKGG